MDNQRPMSEMMSVTMEKIRDMVDVNTVIGDPVNIDANHVIIPVSKVSFGFASGGSDFGKQSDKTALKFGGGSGAGVNVVPIAFLIYSNGEFRILPVPVPASNTSDRIIEMVPDILNKIEGYLNKKGEE